MTTETDPRTYLLEWTLWAEERAGHTAADQAVRLAERGYRLRRPPDDELVPLERAEAIVAELLATGHEPWADPAGHEGSCTARCTVCFPRRLSTI